MGLAPAAAEDDTSTRQLEDAPPSSQPQQLHRGGFAGTGFTATGQALEEDFTCCICCEVLRDPVTVECRHTFCRHCISTCFGQQHPSFGEEDQRQQRPTTRCPRCRGEIAIHYDVNGALVAAMRERHLLRSQQPGACRGKAATINDYDGNRTDTDGEFDIVFTAEGAVEGGGGDAAGAPLTSGRASSTSFEADVVWGRGTVHNTYRETTCRVHGTVSADGELAARAEYSNGPWEEWTGKVIDDVGGSGGPFACRLRGGKYVWHGWDGRVSEGSFELQWRVPPAAADRVQQG